MSRRARRGSGGIKDLFPVVRGAILGVIAFVVGYIVTYLFFILSSVSNFQEQSFQALDISKTDVVGWMFYNSHFVPVDISAEGFGESQSESSNIVAESTELAVPEPFWYAVPILLLIAAGFIIAMTVNGTNNTGRAATAGAMVFVGYLPVSIAGLFVFTSSISTFGISVSIGPSKAMGIVLTGVLFPLALGALGGVIASLTATGSSSNGRSAPDRMS